MQRPPLRDDVLARDRLLDWLHVKIHHRLVLVLAEAGYGKTTLLADFAGRTRLRTLWYRLDEDDRDWVTLLHHLVAAGREHDPAFAPRTAAMLSDSGVGGPARDVVLDMFLRELSGVAQHGAVLILDDLHLVDEAPDAKVVVRELVTRAPERVSIVIASRRAPSISIAKLRAAGEVAELRTNDLRFDATETARLFSESYGRPLEPDVLAELSARTEGWAASLQLVQAALRDRSPAEIRRFVRNLTGADQELYDYLAEEVVGELPEDLQQFLMRTSILQVVRPDLAEAATGLSAAEVRTLTATAERFSLLSRRGSTHRDQLRYHPLVRDFLENRLERSVADASEIEALHRAVATATEAADWRVACHHYAAIGDEAAVVRTIDAAVEEIVARGDVLVAETYLSGLPAEFSATSREVVRSRAELQRGDRDRALARAIAARAADPDSAIALANLAAIAHRAGDLELTLETARELARLPVASISRAIGLGIVSIFEASLDGNLEAAIAGLLNLRSQQRARGYAHHEGTTLLNIAHFHKARGDASAVLSAVSEAMDLLADDPHGPEYVAAQAAKAWALAHAGDLETARGLLQEAIGVADESTRGEVLVEAAEVEAWYGDAEKAGDLVARATPFTETFSVVLSVAKSVRAQLALRGRDVKAAEAHVARFEMGKIDWIPGYNVQQEFVRAYLAVLQDGQQAARLLNDALLKADRQGAMFWAEQARVIQAARLGGSIFSGFVTGLSRDRRVYLSVVAEEVAPCLGSASEDAATILLDEMASRPERWLPTLRDAVDSRRSNAEAAANFLDVVGGNEDVERLRDFVKNERGVSPGLGKGLARRLANKVFVEDQGRVAIRVGQRHIEGATVRRKVLSLLCFLLTRPRFSATRDEVLDVLWPDLEPTVALNSLNQTLYFLRRVIEPSYREDVSPGYVRHESDVIWLDRQLFSSRSQRCYDFIRALGPDPSPREVEQLTALYQGRFALDFAYEDWAESFRETLHASFLQVVENALASDTTNGHFERGVVLARRAIAIDPQAEQIELSLLRLLRAAGAHAAAAEQYTHYATNLRDNLGLEAPPLESL